MFPIPQSHLTSQGPKGTMDAKLKAPKAERQAELASEDWKDSPGWGSGWPGELTLGFQSSDRQAAAACSPRGPG